VALLVSGSAAQTLRNPDFSSSDVSAWSKGTAVSPNLAFTISHDATVGHTAPGALKVTVTAVKRDTLAEVKQQMEGNMTVGQSKVLEGWFKASSVKSNMQFAIQVAESRPCSLNEAGCSGWHWDFVAWRNTLVSASTDWTKFTIAFDRQADTVNFYQVILMVNDTGTVWFDDFAIVDGASVRPHLRAQAATSRTSGAGLVIDIAGRVENRRGVGLATGSRLAPSVQQSATGDRARFILTVQ